MSLPFVDVEYDIVAHEHRRLEPAIDTNRRGKTQ